MKTKSPGDIVASNLHACQIIGGRDVERVAAQIDKQGLTTAQHAFAEWLRELDDHLAKGDTATARNMIALGLSVGI